MEVQTAIYSTKCNSRGVIDRRIYVPDNDDFVTSIINDPSIKNLKKTVDEFRKIIVHDLFSAFFAIFEFNSVSIK